jgi:ATP synthase F1 gamma subunit
MRQLQDIDQERASMMTIVQLTSAFETLASMRISQIKNQVIQAQGFFDELWNIYIQLRVDSIFRFGRHKTQNVIDKELFIIITATGGFGGDIDQRVINRTLEDYDKDKQDIIIVGRHGSVLLAQEGIHYKRFFELPASDHNINVEPLVQEIGQYKNSFVYYQTYISLMNQEIKRLELSTAIKQFNSLAGESKDVISEETYIFEPTAFDVAAHLERSMLQITLGQVIFDSKLAQYASRFRAMSAANDKSKESFSDLNTLYNRTKRAIRDAQLKQIIIGLKMQA